MLFFAAIVAGLFGAAGLGFVMVYWAAELFTNVGGSRDGGPAMAAYFTIGPFGLLAGFLFGFGAAMWAMGNGRFPFLVKACGIGGLVVVAFAMLVVVMTVRKYS